MEGMYGISTSLRGVLKGRRSNPHRVGRAGGDCFVARSSLLAMTIICYYAFLAVALPPFAPASLALRDPFLNPPLCLLLELEALFEREDDERDDVLRDDDDFLRPDPLFFPPPLSLFTVA
jgi:hypothetical protein